MTYEINYLLYNIRQNLQELRTKIHGEKQNMAFNAIKTHLDILDQSINGMPETETVLLEEKKPLKGFEIYIATIQTDRGCYLRLRQPANLKKKLEINDLINKLI